MDPLDLVDEYDEESHHIYEKGKTRSLVGIARSWLSLICIFYVKSSSNHGNVFCFFFEMIIVVDYYLVNLVSSILIFFAINFATILCFSFATIEGYNSSAPALWYIPFIFFEGFWMLHFFVRWMNLVWSWNFFVSFFIFWIEVTTPLFCHFFIELWKNFLV